MNDPFQTPDASTFATMVEATLDVPEYLALLLVESFTTFIDGYAEGQNNYLIYFDKSVGGKATWLPYDYSEDAFQFHSHPEEKWELTNPFLWGQLQVRDWAPVTCRLLNITTNQVMYREMGLVMLDRLFTRSRPRIVQYLDFLRAEVARDGMYTIDYDRNVTKFDMSLDHFDTYYERRNLVFPAYLTGTRSVPIPAYDSDVDH
tara:strand:- start:718 stop:1326 length:609 start_codon:yes stop_codon:yes gene_type:complete